MIGTELARLINARISDVERHAVRYRQGVVAGLNPLTVKLGGSDVPVQATRLVDVGDLQVNDVVSVLSFDADLLVIGQVGTRQAFTALPAGPYHGQRITYQTAGMAADGVRWELEYNANSASAYKWEFIGGSALSSTQSAGASQTTASAATYTAMTNSPSITVPLAGDYRVVACGAIENAGAAGSEGRVAVAVAGTTGPVVGRHAGTGTFDGAVGGATVPVTCAASDAVTLKVATNNQSITFGSGAAWRINVTPVRVG